MMLSSPATCATPRLTGTWLLLRSGEWPLPSPPRVPTQGMASRQLDENQKPYVLHGLQPTNPCQVCGQVEPPQARGDGECTSLCHPAGHKQARPVSPG